MENIRKEILERVEKNEMEKKMREEYKESLLSKMNTAEEIHNEVMNCFHFLDNIYNTFESPEKIKEILEKLNIFSLVLYTDKVYVLLDNKFMHIYRQTIESISNVFVKHMFIKEDTEKIRNLNLVKYFYEELCFGDDIEFYQRILDNNGLQSHIVFTMLENVIRLSRIKP